MESNKKHASEHVLHALEASLCEVSFERTTSHLGRGDARELQKQRRFFF